LISTIWEKEKDEFGFILRAKMVDNAKLA